MTVPTGRCPEAQVKAKPQYIIPVGQPRTRPILIEIKILMSPEQGTPHLKDSPLLGTSMFLEEIQVLL